MEQTPYQVVLMTAASTEEAQKIAKSLVERGLAACVNMIEPCRSIYRWQGKIVDDREVLLLAKTRRVDFDAISKHVSELHSYDVPEIIAVELDQIAAGYRGFLDDVLGG